MKKAMVSIAIIFCIAALTGCANNASPVLNLTPPTCEEALNPLGASPTDAEIEVLLEQALVREEMDTCWKPLMIKSIREKRYIPQNHLEKGILVFNEHQYLDLYHQIISRYFINITGKKSPYEAKDKLLLETYASYVIHHSETAGDYRLIEVKNLCRRLDPDLYRKFFY